MLQLRAADVVVLNKCDLASLSALSAVEDLIQQKAPGVRMLRARFGQVGGTARTIKGLYDNYLHCWPYV